MNNNVFNTSQNPLYVIDNDENAYFEAVKQGNAYITTGVTASQLDENSYFALRVSDPPASQNNIFINSVSIVGAGTNLSNAITLAQGTTTISNMLAPSTFVNADLALSTVNSTATISMGTQTSSPGGTKIEVGTQVESVYQAQYSGGLMLAPGTNLTVYVQNTGNNPVTMYIKVTFWEASI